jgi:hypothetical protein
MGDIQFLDPDRPTTDLVRPGIVMALMQALLYPIWLPAFSKSAFQCMDFGCLFHEQIVWAFRIAAAAWGSVAVILIGVGIRRRRSRAKDLTCPGPPR